MQEYVCGFMFDQKAEKVVLIEKGKPDWQKGKFNGVGGKIEQSDRWAIRAMMREFLEETGVVTLGQQWKQIGSNRGDDFIVWFYGCVGNVNSVRTMETEKVFVISVFSVLAGTVPLVPGALEMMERYINYIRK
jgi:8-oxo-dGTP diphosphatase